MSAVFGQFLTVYVLGASSLYLLQFYVKAGVTRLAACSPFMFFLFQSPFQLDPFQNVIGLGAAIVFCFMALVKVFGFAFGEGPLAFRVWSLPQFMLVLTAIVVPWETKPNENGSLRPFYDPQTRSGHTYVQIIYWCIIKIAIVLPCAALLMANRSFLNDSIVYFIYAVGLYLIGDVLLSVTCICVQPILDVPVMLPFARPFLSESFSDFWGNRWNTAIGGLLRTVVFRPIRSKFKSKLLGTFMGLLFTFLLSSILHEYLVWVFCGYFTGENLIFFMAQPFLMVLEQFVWRQGYQISSRGLRILLTLTLQTILAGWFFFPPYIRCEVTEGAINQLSSYFLSGNRFIRGIIS
eukprot:TRINITY_DN21223_c0_g1_i1.p1 TRINITY_DN21223_c0_g1~~TRINITY_DN21223_c0_g1_i1.p1  ORF type:complete len:373 (-),score=6.56 TRINITY_DN21223_c0_g1_i1:396-1445(-)